MKLREARQEFLLALSGDDRSINTTITYEHVLNRFERYLAPSRLSLELDEIDPLVIQGYLKALRHADPKRRTVDGAYCANGALPLSAVRRIVIPQAL